MTLSQHHAVVPAAYGSHPEATGRELEGVRNVGDPGCYVGQHQPVVPPSALSHPGGTAAEEMPGTRGMNRRFGWVTRDSCIGGRTCNYKAFINCDDYKLFMGELVAYLQATAGGIGTQRGLALYRAAQQLALSVVESHPVDSVAGQGNECSLILEGQSNLPVITHARPGCLEALGTQIAEVVGTDRRRPLLVAANGKTATARGVGVHTGLLTWLQGARDAFTADNTPQGAGRRERARIAQQALGLRAHAALSVNGRNGRFLSMRDAVVISRRTGGGTFHGFIGARHTVYWLEGVGVSWVWLGFSAKMGQGDSDICIGHCTSHLAPGASRRLAGEVAGADSVPSVFALVAAGGLSRNSVVVHANGLITKLQLGARTTNLINRGCDLVAAGRCPGACIGPRSTRQRLRPVMAVRGVEAGAEACPFYISGPGVSRLTPWRGAMLINGVTGECLVPIGVTQVGSMQLGGRASDSGSWGAAALLAQRLPCRSDTSSGVGVVASLGRTNSIEAMEELGVDPGHRPNNDAKPPSDAAPQAVALNYGKLLARCRLRVGPRVKEAFSRVFEGLLGAAQSTEVVRSLTTEIARTNAPTQDVNICMRSWLTYWDSA